jgi:hypothetical protein
MQEGKIRFAVENICAIAANCRYKREENLSLSLSLALCMLEMKIVLFPAQNQ